jgi:NadR type nicotinamide-nucleotide adenylyltransferase
LAQVRHRVCLTVCLTGAECTGKTTLAAELAERYGAIVVPEFAREYAEQVNRALTADDVEPIARGQLDAQQRPGFERQTGKSAPHERTRPTFLDTDLISTVVYARHHYGDCPQWIVDAAREQTADLYLLMDIDQPWIADGVRDSGLRRAQLHREFEETLCAFDARFVTISGDWDARRSCAIETLDAFFSTR